MIKHALYLLFVTSGRISRRTFWITLLVFTILAAIFQRGLLLHEPSSAVYFWGFLIFMVTVIWGFFAIYGKRLKDFGRSVWPIVLLIVFWIAAMLIFGILYGAGDYLAEFSQYERKAIIDETVKQDLREAYEAKLREAPQWFLSLLMWLSLIVFTLWVGLTKGDSGENHYGPPPDQGRSD